MSEFGKGVISTLVAVVIGLIISVIIINKFQLMQYNKEQMKEMKQ